MPLIGLSRHRRQYLVAGGVGVDLELGADRSAAARVALAENALSVAVLTTRAQPDHREVPVALGRYPGSTLIGLGVAVDLELASDGSPIACEALAENTGGAAVLRFTSPDDYEVSVGVGRHIRKVLLTDRVRVDVELAPDRISVLA